MSQLLNTGVKQLALDTKNTNDLYRVKGNSNGYGGYIYKGKVYKTDIFNINWVTANVRNGLPPKDEVYNVTLIEANDKRKMLYGI